MSEDSPLNGGRHIDALEKINAAIEALEAHLALAINHPGTLTFEKRAEIEQRLEALKLKFTA